MALNRRNRILRIIKRAAQCFLIVFVCYLAVLLATIIWTFQAKLNRWPVYIYGMPATFSVGDDVGTSGFFARLGRLGYSTTHDPAPEPGQWYQSGSEVTVFLRNCPFRGEGVVNGPVTFTLEWNHVRSIRLLRSGEQVGSITIEPELITVLPAAGWGPELCRPVGLGKIPPLLISAVLMTEDNRFFSHSGIDLNSIVRALRSNLKAGRYVEGGSTISQQLIRTALLSPDKTLFRKFNEVVLSLLAELIYSKHTILEAYLNRVYLGQHGAYRIRGVAEAATYLFGKDLSELDAAECALLAASIKAPNVITPLKNPDRARGRRNMVLGLLLKEGSISRESHDEAASSPVKMVRMNPMPVRSSAFVEMVKDALPAGVPGSGSEGIHQDVLTSMDGLFQHEAEIHLRPLLTPSTQAHLLLAVPKTGEIRAYLAPHGADAWNGAGGTLGSVLPFALLPALVPVGQEPPKLTLATQFSLPTHPGRPLTLRRVFQSERPYLIRQLLGSVGQDRVLSSLKDFGIKARPDGPAGIALAPVAPLETAQAYCLMASLGKASRINPGVRVLGGFHEDQQPEIMRAYTKPAAMFMVNHLLKDVDSAAKPTAGPDKQPRVQPSLFSGQDGAGVWAVAYREDILLLLRLEGHDQSVTRITKAARRILPPPQTEASQPVPEGLVFRKICADSGMRATSLCPRVTREPFFKGTQPNQWCPIRHDTITDGQRQEPLSE